MNKNISKLAKEFAIERHKGQKRKTGEDYITHPIMVAELVRKYKKSSSNIEEIVAASYLHDVLEDTDTTYYELVNKFGFCVASLVMEVTSIKEMIDAMGKEKYLAIKLLHMTDWALVIKLCDRLHNINDIDLVNEEFRNRYVKETYFILDYVEGKRTLTETQKNIVKDIKKNLEKSNKLNN